MYGVAGYLIEQVTGLKWSEYLRREITMPLELKNTYFSNTEIPIGKHLAKPYVKKGTSLSKCEYWDYFNDDVVSAGGSMSATAEDLIKWARFNLNSATSSVFNESFKHEYSKVHRVHIHDSQVSRIPYNENIGYGHGWFINLYRGKKVLFHTGSIDGFSSALAFIPESGTALAFNMNNTSDYRDNCILLFKLLDWRMIMNKKIFQDYLNDEVTEMTTYESGYVGNAVKLSTKRGNKYVAKEYPFVISKGDIKREWRALKFLQNFGMPVPRPIGFLKDEDNEIILMEHIDGRQLMILSYRHLKAQWTRHHLLCNYANFWKADWRLQESINTMKSFSGYEENLLLSLRRNYQCSTWIIIQETSSCQAMRCIFWMWFIWSVMPDMIYSGHII